MFIFFIVFFLSTNIYANSIDFCKDIQNNNLLKEKDLLLILQNTENYFSTNFIYETNHSNEELINNLKMGISYTVYSPEKSLKRQQDLLNQESIKQSKRDIEQKLIFIYLSNLYSIKSYQELNVFYNNRLVLLNKLLKEHKYLVSLKQKSIKNILEIENIILLLKSAKIENDKKIEQKKKINQYISLNKVDIKHTDYIFYSIKKEKENMNSLYFYSENLEQLVPNINISYNQSLKDYTNNNIQISLSWIMGDNLSERLRKEANLQVMKDFNLKEQKNEEKELSLLEQIKIKDQLLLTKEMIQKQEQLLKIEDTLKNHGLSNQENFQNAYAILINLKEKEKTLEIKFIELYLNYQLKNDNLICSTLLNNIIK